MKALAANTSFQGAVLEDSDILEILSDPVVATRNSSRIARPGRLTATLMLEEQKKSQLQENFLRAANEVKQEFNSVRGELCAI